MGSDGTHEEPFVTSPPATFAAYAPDGQHSLFDSGGELLLANADGTDPSVMFKGGHSCFPPPGSCRDAYLGSLGAFSPDSRFIAATVAWRSSAGAQGTDVTLFATDGRSSWVLNACGGFSRFLEFSPDGSQLIYICQDAGFPPTVIITRHDGTGRRLLRVPRLYATGGYFLPGGRRVVVEAASLGPRGQTGRSRPYVIRTDGSGVSRLRGPLAKASGCVDVSPDQSHVLFTQALPGGARSSHGSAIWVMRRDGSHLREISASRGRNCGSWVRRPGV